MKKELKLMLDFLQGPIWISDIETGKPLTGINIVDSDKTLIDLNYKCSNLYSICYEFDIDDKPCVFNYETARKNKNEMLNLIAKINNRLSEINDGSFYVNDLATKQIEEL